MNSKQSTEDIGPLKEAGGKAMNGQGADKETETKIVGEGFDTAVYSFSEINFQEFLLRA